MTKKWGIALLIVLIAGGATLMKARQHKTDSANTAAAPKAPAAIELLASDVLTLQPGPLQNTLPLTGTLHALNQTVVKAKVAGDVVRLNVREGEYVQQGQALAQIDPADSLARVQAQQAALASARAQLDLATKNRENQRALLEKNFISKNAFDNTLSGYQVAQANVEAAQAQLDIAKKALRDTQVRAPMAGFVEQRLVQAGEKVAIDTRLLTLVDLRQLELEAALPASEIGRVKIGQRVVLNVEGVAEAQTGQVVRINPSAEAGSRAVTIYVRVVQPQSTAIALRSGMFVQGQLVLDQRDQVLTVPVSAVHDESSSSFVYRITRGQIERVPVQLQAASGNLREVLQGLSAGDVIVRNNLGDLQAGQPVVIKNTAEAAPAAKLGATP
ncbi:MAG: efflux RND transporter periplasmic adaptor subunit [Burkholderiaceae bacterium]|nr:MAG: efflux RND transporter periplasmic adaptor subunit [Burkholderiaceae bacterium]